MAAGSTYTPIATYTVPSAQSSYTFSSVPSTYTDLVLVLNLVSTSAGSSDVNINFNGDNSALYSRTYLAGTGTSPGNSGRAGTTSTIQINNWSSVTTAAGYNAVINIMNYANTNVFKTVIARTNNAANAAETSLDLYRSTSAISSILVAAGASRQFDIGSTLTLYGITAA